MKSTSGNNRLKIDETVYSEFSSAQRLHLILDSVQRELTTSELAEMAGYKNNSGVRDELNRHTCLYRPRGKGTRYISHNADVCETVSNLRQGVKKSETVLDSTFWDVSKPFEVSGEQLRDHNSILADHDDREWFPACPMDIEYETIRDDFSKCRAKFSISNGRIMVRMMKKNPKHGYGLNAKHYAEWRRYVDDVIREVTGMRVPLFPVDVDLQQDDLTRSYDAPYAGVVIDELFNLQIYASYRPEVDMYIRHAELEVKGLEAVLNTNPVQEWLTAEKEKIMSLRETQKLLYTARGIVERGEREAYNRQVEFEEKVLQGLTDFTTDQSAVLEQLHTDLDRHRSAIGYEVQQLNERVGYSQMLIEDRLNMEENHTKYQQEELLVGIHRMLDEIVKEKEKPGLLTRIWRRLF